MLWNSWDGEASLDLKTLTGYYDLFLWNERLLNYFLIGELLSLIETWLLKSWKSMVPID